MSKLLMSGKQRRRWSGLVLVLIVGVGFLSLAGSPAAPVEAATSWQDTSFKFDPNNTHICIDGSQANTLLISLDSYNTGSEPRLEQGTYTLNWKTGAIKRISDLFFYDCDEENGVVYYTSASHQILQFSSRDPQPHEVAHRPCLSAHDGSRLAYTCDHERGSDNKDTLTIFASSDAGRTWQQRPHTFTGFFIYQTMSNSDGRVLYVLTCPDYSSGSGCRVYFSGDAGLTWEERGDPQMAMSYLYFSVLPGRNTPRDYLVVGSSTPTSVIKISTDGGRSFRQVASFNTCQSRDCSNSTTSEDVFESNRGLLLYSCDGKSNARLELSTDGGISWQDLPPMPRPASQVPDQELNRTGYPELKQLPNSLDSFIWLDHSPGGYIWLTTDGGQSWQKIAPRNDYVRITPYSPTVLLEIPTSGTGAAPISTLDLPQADQQTLTAPAPASGATGSVYYTPTGHNLPAVFRSYWEQHGGLAQFGYPRTEPLYEANPTDGKVYLVQYFERNRFEYHPEYAGTKYEVLLGLLGNEQTATRRDEKPFQPVANPNRSATLYFDATGHTLANSFRTYWEQHGGLALYGYPISEEFEEINPDDGQTYTVQYFERNRFEYHPKNKGTPYEVELGLLGNTLLKQKGWL